MNQKVFYCGFCGSNNSGDREICYLCGNSFGKKPVRNIQTKIAHDQIFWILFGGFSTFFILKYVIKHSLYINGVPFTVIIATLTSFIMISRLFLLLRVYKSDSLKIFFPNFLVFFILAGFIIWFLDILLALSLSFSHLKDFNLYIQEIIIPYSINFVQGYILGIIIPLFFKYYKTTRININNS